MAKNSEDDENEDDSCVVIGSALPVYDIDEAPLRKPVGIHEQTVCDAQGRLRFHGAFTGGFSAGYFNSVGSKEGWAPKAFVSSRSQRADAASRQKPEDYMDEEDVGEFGIAPRVIATRDNFMSNERDRKRKSAVVSSMAAESRIPGVESVLFDLIIPKRSSIGIRLLRKLGWKDGQGIGPKVKRKLHKGASQIVQQESKVYGVIMPPGYQSAAHEQSSSEDESVSVKFAPKDVCPVNFEAKQDLHGIGYRGLDPRLALGHFSLGEPAVVLSAGKRGIRGQAFGVGALENEDDDIYGGDSMANYDHELGDESSERSNFGWTAPKHHLDNDVKAKTVGHVADVLPGFKKASSSLQPRKTYAPPQLPKNFKPFHRFESSLEQPSSVTASGRPKALDAFARGTLLGESPHLNSVFELVSGEDRAHMEAAKMQGDIVKRQLEKAAALPLAVGASQNAILSENVVLPLDGSDMKPETSSSTSMPTSQWNSAVGFAPFAKNPEKQKRYEEYLDSTKRGNTYEPSHDVHTTEWEQQREREEFAQAARLYRPLAGMMASRFTRAEHDDDDKVALPTEKPENKSEKDKAASLKMFGKLTRERIEWHPDKLLCKRFNIANPYPDSTIVGVPTIKRDKYSVFNFLSFPEQETGHQSSAQRSDSAARPEIPSSPAAAVKSSTTVNIKPLAILATMDLRPRQSNAELTVDSQGMTDEAIVSEPVQLEKGVSTDTNDGRPSMDLFKAIFENSDTSSSSESEADDDDAVETKAGIMLNSMPDIAASQPDLMINLPVSIAPHVVSAHTEPVVVPAHSSGIGSETGTKVKEEVSLDAVSNASRSSEDITFGPALPPVNSSTDASRSGHKHSSRRHHRRKESHSSHKKSKHQKKKKSSKHKKTKKKSKTVVAINSSSSSDADIEDAEDSDELSTLDRKLLSRYQSSCNLHGAYTVLR